MISGSNNPNPCKVLVVSDGKKGPSATQRISFGEPFAHDPLERYRIIFAGERPEGTEIAAAFEAIAPQLLVLSRSTSSAGAEWIKAAGEARVPVVFHIDDDLLSVPPSLGEAKFNSYNDPVRLAALRANIEASDLLYVSTSALADRFAEHGIQTPTVAGEIYCSVSGDDIGALVAPATGPVIGYMGTSGHAADLDTILPAICDVMEKVPSLQFELFGTIRMPSVLEGFGRRVRHLSPVADYREFVAKLRSLGWWIGLAPLEDNSFNRCKADTKWVEYSQAGIAVIASDLPVYERACADGAGILAHTPEQWSRSCLELLYRPQLRVVTVQKAQERLRQLYSHDLLRAQVDRIFERVLQPA
jgi:hypothetical protein